MTERIESHDTQEQIPQLELAGPLRVEAAHLGHEYGVPEEILPHVTEEVRSALERAGIDPEAVLFAGYNDNGDDPDAEKLAKQRHDLTAGLGGYGLHGADVGYGDDYGDIEDNGDDLAGPDEADLMREFGLESGAAELPAYDLVSFDNFNESQDSESNPVHYAGTVPSATIGVYDKRLVAGLEPSYDPAGDRNWVMVHANLDQLRSAMVAEIHPRYVEATEGEQTAA
jgi:hypothetical protein